MKSIREITEKEAKEILKETLDGDDWAFSKLSFDPVIDEKGYQQVTFSGNSIVGICYKTGLNWDSALKSFDDLDVMKWLYKHNYDISDSLDAYIEGEKEDKLYRDQFFEEYDLLKKELEKLRGQHEAT